MKKAIFVFFCTALLSACASQQDMINLDYRLARLERENAEIKKKLNASEESLDQRLAKLGESRQEQEFELRSQSADVHVKVDRLKEELRTLNGRIEELQYRLDRELGATGESPVNIGEMAAHNDTRLDRVEKYLNLEPMKKTKTETPSPVAETRQAPASALPNKDVSAESSDTDMYIAAKQAFDKGRYEEARNGFEAMLEKYPDSSRADNAQFWIGETYYQERWYEKAILEYQKVIEDYSKGNKVAAAMLKQGFAFLNLGDKDSARLTLKDLARKFPSSNEAAVAKKKLGEL